MHLLNALVAGIKGCENGTAAIFKRGTSTRAVYFTDFEGLGAVSTGADVQLDANGGATVYVNELCDVQVKDSLGALRRDFVAGDASGAVEYQGQSFTGVDYVTGASGAGKPTNLQAILDLWKTQNGYIDWKVLVGSSIKTIPAALAALSGLFFNVKDPAYGAVGDGVADDTAAIAAAMTAADVIGGIVFFPAGTYRITSQLTLGNKTSMMGVGSAGSLVRMDHASNDTLRLTANTVPNLFVDGIAFQAAQSNTGAVVTFAASCKTLFRNCSFGSPSNGLTAGTKIVSIPTDLSQTIRAVFEDCAFYPGASNTQVVSMADTALYVKLTRCYFSTPASYSPANGAVYGTHLYLDDCMFYNFLATAGTYSNIKFNTAGIVGAVRGCYFYATSGATATAMELGTYSSGSVFYEANNTFGGSGLTAYSYSALVASKGAQVTLATRETRCYTVTSNAANLALPTDQYGRITLQRTSNAAQSVTSTRIPEGATLHFSIYNNGAGAAFAGPTINTPIVIIGGLPATGNGQTADVFFVSRAWVDMYMHNIAAAVLGIP